MTPELTILTLAALLQVVLYGFYTVATQRQVGRRVALGPRDEAVTLTGKVGRLQRTMQNHFESLVLFAIATLVLTFSDQGNATTTIACGLYLAARIVYVPCYILGLSPWRSLVWTVGFLATTYLLVVALP